MTDKDLFYQKASTPLIEHQDLETAVHHCMKVLKKYMPADGMTIQLLEPSLKSSRSILCVPANSDIGHKLHNAIVPMPLKTRSFLKKNPVPDVRIINRPELDPVYEFLTEVAGKNYSNMSMFLLKHGKRFGVVILMAKGRDRYSQEHLELFSRLRVPFTIALNYYLQGLEIIKLKNILDEREDQKKPRLLVEDIIGHKFGLRDAMNHIRLIAPLNNPVLINGETGVGKELIANAIHFASSNRDGPLITVNCGAIPETIVDSELFGHEKGAFTGATDQRKGRFERAHHGTIFLDEIGELKPDIQVKLLRVLQTGEIERVGGSKQIKIDTRILAATHRNLDNMVAQGKFREDLLFRINVFPIIIPPLRARTQDIPALVDHFIRKKAKELTIYPTPLLGKHAIDTLMSYHWPGNVRELENVVERELILYIDGPLTFTNFNMAPVKQKGSKTMKTKKVSHSLEDVISTHIQQTLAQTGGRINGTKGAAKILGIHPNTLRNKMNKLCIPYKKSQINN